MKKPEDKETRYYLDLDLKTGTILGLDYDQRENLVKHRFANPSHHRVYLTKGQFNKLVQKTEP